MLISERLHAETLPRSHSLVSRMTGNHVGSTRRSSNLRLGAIVDLPIVLIIQLSAYGCWVIS